MADVEQVSALGVASCTFYTWEPGSLLAQTNAVAPISEMCGGVTGRTGGADLQEKQELQVSRDWACGWKRLMSGWNSW